MDAKRLRMVAFGLAVVALLATVAGFFASWERTRGNVPAFGGFNGFGGFGRVPSSAGGEVDVRYGLRGSDVRSPFGNGTDDYAGASPELRQTFLVQSVVVWTATGLGVAAAGLVAAALWLDQRRALLAGIVALALLALVSLAGAGLFMNNFPNTDEGGSDDDRSFWGSDNGFTWGPGLAWYAEVNAGLLAGIGAGVAWISGRPSPPLRPRESS